MTLEQMIKRALDGTFTRWDHNTGKVITVDVPHDFIPNHHNAGRQLGEAGPQIPWTQHDDTILLELKRRRLAHWDIGERMGRTEDSVRHRLKVLMGRKA